MPEHEVTLAEEARRFLEEVAALPVAAEPRARYEFLCARFAGAKAEVAEILEVESPVRGRLYRQGAGPFLVWFHGGRFISGSLETHDALCRMLARALEGTVLAADYRLAPEHPYPAALEDARAVARYALSMDAGAAVGGDSAGAALALASGLETAVLVYPMVDPACGTPSHARFAGGPGPSSKDMSAGWWQFLPPAAEFRLPLDHVRRALVVTAGIDPLRDEGLELAGRLAGAEHLHLGGHIHGFMTYPARFGAAAEVVGRIASFLRRRA